MSIPGARLDPFPAYNFYIYLIDHSGALGGIETVLNIAINLFASGGFTECSGLEATLQVEEYSEGGENSFIHKFPSRMTYPNIILKRGVGFSEDLWNWHFDYVRGKGKRRDGLIILPSGAAFPGAYDLANRATGGRGNLAEVLGSAIPQTGAKIWRFKKGLPLRWTGPTFNATQSAVAVESMEIAHQGLDLISPGAGVGQAFEAIGNLF
jgi:phage tail-like protein